VFLSEALQVLMDPQHILYEKVNVFFLQRPALDLDDIPMAYALSNTGEYFEKEVDWLLNIMTAGLDDPKVHSPAYWFLTNSLCQCISDDIYWSFSSD
jgi:hypothetical protein